jgi:hypothetical protein
MMFFSIPKVPGLAGAASLTEASGMNSLRSILLFAFGLEAFEFLFGNRHVLIFGMLESADEISTLNDSADCARASHTYCAAGGKIRFRF